jgi:hypothetical protein
MSARRHFALTHISAHRKDLECGSPVPAFVTEQDCNRKSDSRAFAVQNVGVLTFLAGHSRTKIFAIA